MSDAGGVMVISPGLMEREREREKMRDHAIKISIPYLVSLYPQPALPPIPRLSYSPLPSNSFLTPHNLSSRIPKKKNNISKTGRVPFIVTNIDDGSRSRANGMRRERTDGCECQSCGYSSGSSTQHEIQSKKGAYKQTPTKVHIVEASSSSSSLREWLTPRQTKQLLLTPLTTPTSPHTSNRSIPSSRTLRLNNTPEENTPPLSPPSPHNQRRSIFSSLRGTPSTSTTRRQDSRARPSISLGGFPGSEEDEEEPVTGRPGMDLLWMLLQKGKACWSPDDEEEVDELSNESGQTRESRGEWDWDLTRSSYLSPRSTRIMTHAESALQHPLLPTTSRLGYSYKPRPRGRAPPPLVDEGNITLTHTRTWTMDTDDLPITLSIPLLAIENVIPKPPTSPKRRIPISPLVPSTQKSPSSSSTMVSPIRRGTTPFPANERLGSVISGAGGGAGAGRNETELRIQVLEWSMVKSGKLCGVRSRVVVDDVRREIV